jgi:hypothetical protein
LSFFDEADEPRTAPTPRRRRRPSGGGRRPPTEQQAIRIRRAVAATALLIVVILIAVGVHSCQISQRNSALKDYNNNVSSVIQDSDQAGHQFFGVLSSGGGSRNAINLQAQINETGATANSQLDRAKGMNVPSEVRGAQQNLLLALQMRRDAIGDIALQIQPALGGATSTDAVKRIAADMARFYASDVLYKDYTLPLIASALTGAGLAVGPPNGATFNDGQFLTDVQWLTPTYVAAQLHASLPTPAGKVKAAPGVHGHRLDSVTVGGTALSTVSTNTVPASPPPTFTCLFTNDGANTETNVVVKVTVNGTSISGQAIVPQTTPGQQATAQVTLSSSPPAGTYPVTATIERVPGETVVTHNTKSFQVTFQ